jgi:hypothetical protein
MNDISEPTPATPGPDEKPVVEIMPPIEEERPSSLSLVVGDV